MKFSNLRIPNPCHENWDKMSATDRGRFCQSCKKEVFDFTSGQPETFQHIWQEQAGDVCGRFRAEDLAPSWQFWDLSMNRRQPFLRFRRMLASRIAVLGLGLGTAYAQLPPANEGGQLIVRPWKSDKQQNSFIQLSGKVQDVTSKDGLARASLVVLAGDELVAGTYADESGAFELNFPRKKIQSDSLTLKIRYLHHVFVKEGLEIESADVLIELNSIVWMNEVEIATDGSKILMGMGLVGGAVIICESENRQPINSSIPRYDTLEEWIWMNRSDVFSKDF